MSFSEQQLAELSAKLNPAHVSQRTQSGRSLSYIEGWHAIAEANRIFGFAAWCRETLELRQVAEHQRRVGQGEGWGVSYIARVRITVMTPGGDCITREGVGTGHGIDRDLGLAHESAAKEAETDAMKRALMTFGNPFGLALYDKSQANVGSDEPPARPARQTKEEKAASAAMNTNEDEVRGWKTWAAGIAASVDQRDAEALMALQRSTEFVRGMEILDVHAPAYSERLRAKLIDRADALRAMAA